MDTADITVEFACSRKEMVNERIESVHIERHGIDHEILSVEPGRIPEGRDECDLPEYRRMHGLSDAPIDQSWGWHVPEGCVCYVAHVHLSDRDGASITRERVLAIPFGDRDLGFSIERIGETD